MIAIVSHSSISSDRSCVMKMTEKPRVSFSSAMVSMTCRWMTTSSAVVGSSITTISGSRASPIAIMARCRIPPDSSCG